MVNGCNVKWDNEGVMGQREVGRRLSTQPNPTHSMELRRKARDCGTAHTHAVGAYITTLEIVCVWWLLECTHGCCVERRFAQFDLLGAE